MTALEIAAPATPRAADWMNVWPEAERAVHRSVKGRLPPGVEPDDISQQVFIDLLRAGLNAPPPDRLRFWAVAVARRVVADLYRRKTVPLEDLALAPVVDIESIALARLRCEVAADAYAEMSRADREALAVGGEGSGPMPNKTKLRRSRARRTLREKAARLVGAGVLMPRWSWLAGTTGAAAVIVPLCLGLGGPMGDTTPDTPHRTPGQGGSIIQGAGEIDSPSESGRDAHSAAATAASGAPVAAPADGPTYHRRLSVDVPVAGPAGYDHYAPPSAAGPPPVACAENLQVSDSVCVEHPLR